MILFLGTSTRERERERERVRKLCNLAFESGAAPEDWRTTVIVSLYMGKDERNVRIERVIICYVCMGKVWRGICRRVGKRENGRNSTVGSIPSFLVFYGIV